MDSLRASSGRRAGQLRDWPGLYSRREFEFPRRSSAPVLPRLLTETRRGVNKQGSSDPCDPRSRCVEAGSWPCAADYGLPSPNSSGGPPGSGSVTPMIV
jgi:hypothetical protein